MHRELTLTHERIDEAALIATRAQLTATGAVVCFSGVVRESEGTATVAALDYEAFERMVHRQFELLFDQIEQRWPVQSVRVAHRLSRVEVGETSLWLEILAPHRQEALAACSFLIDEMKRVAPIWKKPLVKPVR